jgi:hypothetical protein
LIASAAVMAGFAGAVGAHPDEHSRLPENFRGLLNDYTPPAPTVSGGPYEMHGRWSLRLHDRSPAVFVAEMTMETADFANMDPNHDPTKLGPHTHHISVTDGVLHDDPSVRSVGRQIARLSSRRSRTALSLRELLTSPGTEAIRPLATPPR